MQRAGALKLPKSEKHKKSVLRPSENDVIKADFVIYGIRFALFHF
jgi:hypothetical protein